MGTGNRCARPLIASLVMSFALALLVAGSPAMAKKKPPLPRAVSGRVLDQDDNGISGAAVELTDLQTGKKVAIFSAADGRYQFSDLSMTDDYQVQASYKGVSSETRKASALQDRQLILNLHIPPPKS